MLFSGCVWAPFLSAHDCMIGKLIMLSCASLLGGDMVTESEKAYASMCAAKNPHAFYCWHKWLNVRAKVLALDKNECQLCRYKYHRYRKADIVHHINHLKNRPDLSLEIWYDDPATHEKKRNLISLCHDCHEEVHGWRCKPKEAPITEECWE